MTMASALVLSKSRAYYYDVGVGFSVDKNDKRGCVQGKGHTLAAMARRQANDSNGGADVTMALARQGQGDDFARSDQARQGNSTVASSQKYQNIMDNTH
jgi:hypothetical protein